MIDERKSKAEVEHQATPKKRMRCEVCTNFIPMEDCKAIKGRVGPNGWCKLYDSKRQAVK